MLRRLIIPTVRNLARPSNHGINVSRAFASGHHNEVPAPGSTMDDLPVPSGSWEAKYNANQTKYNIQLALGVLFFSITIIAAKGTGLMYLNFYPPELPKDSN